MAHLAFIELRNINYTELYVCFCTRLRYTVHTAQVCKANCTVGIVNERVSYSRNIL